MAWVICCCCIVVLLSPGFKLVRFSKEAHVIEERRFLLKNEKQVLSFP